MTKQISLIALTFLFCFICCNSKKNVALFSNNFDELNEWGYSSDILVEGSAHSGKWMCELDSLRPYSITFRKKLNELSSKNFKTIRAEGWIKLSSINAKANLVVAIDSINGNAFKWNAISSESQISEQNKWTKVFGEFNFPERMSPDFDLLVYVWNNGNKKIWVDDVSIQIIE
jgi:hypothetical protein